MMLKLGNLSPEQFAERVGADFTPDEILRLHAVWSRNATLTGPDDFHIFDDPAITIHVGSATSNTVEIFKTANERKAFNREITFYLDEKWETAA